MCSNQCGTGLQNRKTVCETDIKTDKCQHYKEEERYCSSAELCSLGEKFTTQTLKTYLQNYSFWTDCHRTVVGDGYCDDFYNWEICDFDGGDCCLKNVNDLFCRSLSKRFHGYKRFTTKFCFIPVFVSAFPMNIFSWSFVFMN